VLPSARIISEAIKIMDKQLKEFESQIKVRKGEES